MNNRAALNLKYVIWGQRIWNPSRDSVGPWTGWRGMEDRGDVTQNHWYVGLAPTLIPSTLTMVDSGIMFMLATTEESRFYSSGGDILPISLCRP